MLHIKKLSQRLKQGLMRGKKMAVDALIINSIGWARDSGPMLSCTVPSVDSVQDRDPVFQNTRC